MTFEDLPPDWPTRPVTDPAITADLLDLIVGERDRSVGALGVLLCGAEGRLLQPIVVEAPVVDASAAERRRGFDSLCQAFCHLDDGADEGESAGFGVLVALARPGPPLVTPADRGWRETAELSCRSNGVRLLDMWLVTPRVIRPLPPSVSRRRSA